VKSTFKRHAPAVRRRFGAVLVCLAEHAGDVVSRNTLYDSVWGKTVVTDQALTHCIPELRHQALQRQDGILLPLWRL
jgi:DNA-binding winged helix-turn-helix (wHTH) protein